MNKPRTENGDLWCTPKPESWLISIHTIPYTYPLCHDIPTYNIQICTLHTYCRLFAKSERAAEH